MSKKKILFIVLSIVCLITSIVGATYSWLADRTYSDVDLTASIQRNYFESGDGSSLNPFEIKRPIQLYYFSWLQQMGYFNKPSSSASTIDQYYFYLSDDIDMQGFTIPSIGTNEYPFIGFFDGRGHVVSNLCIQNNHNTFTNEPKNANYETNDDTQIVGFFGVVGALDGSNSINGYTYNKSVNIIKNFCLNSVVITSETPKDDKTLIGIVAGYVNGEISGVAVCNSAIFVKSGLNSIGNTLFTKISDYSTVGYCEEEYKNYIQITEVSLSEIIIQTEGGSESGGTDPGELGPGGEPVDDVPGNAWGGTINMVNLYNRLIDIYQNKADTSNSYYTSEVRYQYIGNPELNKTENRSDGGTVTTGFTSEIPGLSYIMNNFAIYDENYDEGALTFSKGLFGNNDYIYLMGEIDESFGESNPYINKYSIVHTLEKQNITGMYIYSGNNYLSVSVTDGTPSLVNITDKANASIWFVNSDNRVFTQMDGSNYYLAYDSPTFNIGLPSLSVVDETSSNVVRWTTSGSDISVKVLNVRRTLISSAADIWLYIKYQNGWSLVEADTSTMLITDGTNYLSATGSGDYLTETNSTSTSSATAWTYDANAKTIYTTISGVQYYIINNNGVLDIVSANVLSTNATMWDTSTQNGLNYIKSSIGSVDYTIEYHNGWVLWPSSYYKIHYGTYYLQATNSLELVKTEASSSATNWVFTNGTSGGKISSVINDRNYYLAVTTVSGSVKLTLSTTVQTTWTTETPYLNKYFEGGSVYSITTTYNSVKYFLFCEGGIWSVVRADANRYVVGYKYSTQASGSNNAIWLSHNLNTGSGDNFTTSNSLATTVIFTWDSNGYLYAKNGSSKMYLGVYISSIYSVHTETSTRYWMKVSINSSGEFVCKYKTYTKYLKCNGSRFGYNGTYSQDAILSRPPMSLDAVTGQNINFVQNNGSASLENVDASYFSEVLGSPESVVKTNASKLHGTYIPITTVSDTSYITSQRNTGYIVGGSNYRKYGDFSSYRIGDVRVSQYNLSDLASGYFDSTTREVTQVLTSNAKGASQIYDMQNGSSYFNKALPKLQTILKEDAQNSMYGIHFMDARISIENTMIAEKAIIEHVSYFDYEMPESSINFTLASSGYINFFAGTYANDSIVGDNDAFFSMYQVFRYQNLLPAEAIVAVYECSGRPTIFKMNNGKYYYNDSGSIVYIYNIDNLFGTGKSIDDLYLQVTSGVYMDKTNSSNTIYYTLRNDVTPNHYYTFNRSSATFSTHYSALSSNYILAFTIKEIKKLSAIYSKYTSQGASSLATLDMIYLYSDGTYSKGDYSTISSGITENTDGSLTYNDTRYSLIFDLSWIDTSVELVSNAIYYFEIPVVNGEYCLGSVDGGKGAYLLYLDLSTNASRGNNQDGVVDEIALVETKTTIIETYEFPQGISIIEDASDYDSDTISSLKDYETISIALSNPDNFTISRSGDSIIITDSTTGNVVYIGYGLTASNSSSSAYSSRPSKTSMIVEDTTIIQSIEIDSLGTESTVKKTYVSTNEIIVTNTKLTLDEDSILHIKTYDLIDSSVGVDVVDNSPIDVELDFDLNDQFALTNVDATIVNNSSKTLPVKLLELENNLSYTYKKQNGTQIDTITVNYTLTVLPESFDTVGDEVDLQPSS